MLFSVVFFFSSRRRHTRFDCDWSSDVCSSDLARCGITKVGAGDGGIFCVRIDIISIFAQRRSEVDRLRHFKRDAAWARVQNIVAAKRDLFPALFAPLVRNEVRELSIAFGSGRMRFGGERAMPFASLFG